MSIFKGIRGFSSGKLKRSLEQSVIDVPATSNSAWVQTLNRWEKVSRLNQNDINAKVQIILSHYNLGHIDKSNELIEQLNKDHPEDLFVKLASARHAQRVEDYKLAFVRWSALQAMYPEMIEPLLGIASIKVSEGDYDGAFKLTNTVIKLDPKESQSYAIQGRIYHRNEDWENALRCWDIAIELSGGGFEAELHRATALTKLERYQEVIDSVEISIARNDLKVPFILIKIKVYAIQGRDTEVVRLCDEILAVKPANINAAHAKSYALFRLEDHLAAEKACDYALSLDENDVQMLTLSARIAQCMAKNVA